MTSKGQSGFIRACPVKPIHSSSCYSYVKLLWYDSHHAFFQFQGILCLLSLLDNPSCSKLTLREVSNIFLKILCWQQVLTSCNLRISPIEEDFYLKKCSISVWCFSNAQETMFHWFQCTKLCLGTPYPLAIFPSICGSRCSGVVACCLLGPYFMLIW